MSETIKPLTKAAALDKWFFLSDSNARQKSYSMPCDFSGQPWEVRTLAGVIALGGTPEVLAVLWGETKHLSWPETYGTSPWETACTAGAAFSSRKADEPFAPGSFYGDQIAKYETALRIVGAHHNVEDAANDQGGPSP